MSPLLWFAGGLAVGTALGFITDHFVGDRWLEWREDRRHQARLRDDVRRLVASDEDYRARRGPF